MIGCLQSPGWLPGTFVRPGPDDNGEPMIHEKVNELRTNGLKL